MGSRLGRGGRAVGVEEVEAAVVGGVGDEFVEAAELGLFAFGIEDPVEGGAAVAWGLGLEEAPGSGVGAEADFELWRQLGGLVLVGVAA